MRTYQDLEDVDLIDESGVVFDLLLLNGLDGEFLVRFTMLSQVDNAEAAICQLLLEGVDLLDVAFG